MADDDKANKGENDKDEKEEEDVETDETEDDDDDSGEGDDKDSKTKKDPELEKAIRRRDRVLAENRRLKAQIAASDKNDDKDKGPSAEEKANARIVRSSARAVLAAQGVTEKDDQASVLAILNLADIEVDEDGDPDEDAIEERITDLRRIFGGSEKRTTRVPRTTSTKDKGGSSNQADPDSARYKRFMSGRG